MADFERQHAALPPTPGPTLERHDPQDPGLYHTNPHTDLPEHLDVQDEGPHVVNGPGHGTKEYALQDPEKIERASRICGLRRKIFWPLLGLVILIVVGAIAGGLGGALVNQKNNDASVPNNTPSPVPTSSTATSSPTSSVNASITDTNDVNVTSIRSSNDCKDKTLYASQVNNIQYLMRCKSELGFYNEIMDIFTVSFALCMDACSASHATETNPNATDCSRVMYQANSTQESSGGANCYLLSANDTQGLGRSSDIYDSADSTLNGSGRKHRTRSPGVLSSFFGLT